MKNLQYARVGAVRQKRTSQTNKPSATLDMILPSKGLQNKTQLFKAY